MPAPFSRVVSEPPEHPRHARQQDYRKKTEKVLVS